MLDEYVTADRELQQAFDSLVVDALRMAQTRNDDTWRKLIARQGEIYVEAATQRAHNALQDGDFHEAVMALFNGASKLERLAAGLSASPVGQGIPAARH